MDPEANLARQRDLAARIVKLGDADDQQAAELAVELAELVLALDDWRRMGGFDPYLADQ